MVTRIIRDVRGRLRDLCRSNKDGIIQLLRQSAQVVLQREATKISQYVHDPILCHSSVQSQKLTKD